MKRIFGYVLFVLGLTFVFLSPFLLFYTVPRVEKAPTDVDQTVISEGFGQYFSAQRLNYIGPVVMTAVERFKGSPEKSTEDVAVINYQNHVIARTPAGTSTSTKRSTPWTAAPARPSTAAARSPSTRPGAEVPVRRPEADLPAVGRGIGRRLPGRVRR
jgi:hypothetical protein